MRIVGIDPSLRNTGVAIIDNGALVELTSIPTKKLTGEMRVQFILEHIEKFVQGADIIGIEGVSYNSVSSRLNEVYGLWGILNHYLWQNFRSPVIVTPATRAKYATGKGNASKDTVMAAVIRRYMDERITGNDEADALVVAAILSRLAGSPIEDSLPATHLAALDKMEPLDAVSLGASLTSSGAITASLITSASAPPSPQVAAAPAAASVAVAERPVAALARERCLGCARFH
ncbi:crossover junction endodeoxyribonuclease RuvC [Jonesiaceae bacterium BS-20]|uniref:Crossover junction endodeoxyribonuclease RuvC n=1 Tax=Jonesiaceae bacterium BS-20 TaxID=3120821 RepID=A0AAU7E073_9MICO